jgi:hypothetical protein
VISDFGDRAVFSSPSTRSRRTTMKTVLVAAAALGLTVSAASAECAWHSKVSASVDTQTKTASVAQTDVSSTAEAQTIKKATPPKTE